MISRPATRCPLWQRQLCINPEATRVVEDTDWEPLQRVNFLTKFSRRKASSVPGPLESRRRLGKRRLGHLSEVSQVPMQHIGAIWDIFANREKSQWQWEAPLKRQERTTEAARPQLPSWLTGREPLSEEREVTDFEEEVPPPEFESNPSDVVETDIREFCKALEGGLPHRITLLCDSFSHQYQHNIMLGLVSGHNLSANLRELSRIIREATTDKAQVDSCCLSLYLATWEGIKTSKVLGPSDLESGVIDGLLQLLGDLPSLSSVQTLVTDIIYTSSIDQIDEMEQGLLAVVKSWLSGLCHLAKINANYNRMELVSDDSIPYRESSKQFTDMVKGLTKLLGLLPAHMVNTIVSSSTDYIISAYFGATTLRTFRTLRYSWMSVLANTPYVDEDLLVTAWSAMDSPQIRLESPEAVTPKITRLKLHESCKLLLDFWISHGHLKAPEDIRATFYASITRSSKDHVYHLLQAIIKHGEDLEAKMRSLLWVMRRVGRPRAIYDIFMILRDADIRVPAPLLEAEIKEMSGIDARWAWSIYKLYPKLRHDGTPLPLENCPELVLAMIKCPAFHPNDVWVALGMRPYDIQWLLSSSKTVAWERSSLIHQMAWAFAQAESLSPRIAFRNVCRCARYLSQHQIPLGTVLSRALTHAALIRNLLRGRGFGTERALYTLDFIRQVEGHEVSAGMDKALHAWQIECHEMLKQEKRAANPLRLPRSK